MTDRFGEWTVDWTADGFSVRIPEQGREESFRFARIVLPVDIVIGDSPTYEPRVMLRLHPAPHVAVLSGAPRSELERFKKKVSGEVLAAVRKSPFGCADCARDAGILATRWSDAPCPGCRQAYCGNPRCLRRLQLVTQGPLRICKRCGLEPAGESAASRRALHRM